jgi:hypothetical protein
MALVVVHLRWNGVADEQHEEVRRAAPDGGALPAGCLSRRLTRQGSALLATEVWEDAGPGDRMTALPEVVRLAGVATVPQTAIFEVPGPYAAVYRRQAAALAARSAAAPVLPRPAGAPEAERIPERIDGAVPAR